MFDEELMPYQKKAKHDKVKKSKHKHEYAPCRYRFVRIGRLDPAYGFLKEEVVRDGTYCPKCGKVGHIYAWFWDRSQYPYKGDEPVFYLKNGEFQKYIEGEWPE